VTVAVRPISDRELDAVGQFLHLTLNSRVSAAAWVKAMTVPWPVNSPNRGFLLEDDGEVVGAYLAFYSNRVVDGHTEPFCNLGAWCVAESYRFHSAKLLKALLAQDGYTFTDLSPSGTVMAMNERLNFRYLDTATALIPCLPRPSVPGRWRVHTGAAIADVLTGRDLSIYLDHRDTAAALHVVLSRGDQHCYVVFRRDRRKNLPLFASVLYVSDPELFAAGIGVFTRHLLLRRRVLLLLAELRITGRPPRLSRLLPAPRRKMLRAAPNSHVEPGRIDYLYSELTCVAW
jgi:hypothetical protein